MIKDIMIHNADTAAGQKELEVLKKYFPQCFHADGEFDIEAFKAALPGGTTITDETSGFNWLGKNYARMLTNMDTTTLIRPDEEHNAKPENKDSQNVYISGDNLDALQHLVKSYSGKVKVIYIDPPYNTGSDGFVYNDKFNFTADELAKRLDVSPERAERILSMTRRGSASHAAWLTFMLPRLSFARDLLTDDGVNFISIDDNEQANLKRLCDEVFGEDNFIAQIIIQSNKRGQTYKQIAKTHEYLLVYSKSGEAIIQELKKELTGNIQKDNIGEFSERELRNRNPKYGRFNRPNLFYPIYANPNIKDENGYHPVSDTRSLEYSIEILPYNSENGESCWRWGKTKLNNNIETSSMDSNVVAREKTSGQWGVYEKYRKETYKAKTIWLEDVEIPNEGDVDDQIWDETGVITEQGSVELKKYDMADTFDFPKPTYLIKKLLTLGSDRNSICMDFFSGSGSTADALLNLNLLDGCRKFIAVQLPVDMDQKLKVTPINDKAKVQKVIDFLDKNHYPHTLDYVGFERIRRAAKKIHDANPLFTGDLGFKHYTLEEPKEDALLLMEKFDPVSNNITTLSVEDFGLQTVLHTWLVADGYGLTEDAEEVMLGNYKAYWKRDHLYMINPDHDFNESSVAALMDKYNGEPFSPHNIVIFGYSFGFTHREELQKNLRTLKDGNKTLTVNIDVRY
ncbi:site-specific DNA-methyltransferase [Prevotella intermedia]|uniref:site-specific DNA-methyltransferase (adenine-specific) n=1 Tax=Prevotella intermedia TaxID=28131 RepID=A0A2M8TR09_PREIN|nr:site-specific DNA-methyltransferase [Prevotella intermedia]PJI26379.1 restriction endonuclease subunit M [Prevotella intermedia]